MSSSNKKSINRNLIRIYADERVRSFLSQLVIAIAIILIGIFFVSNTTNNLNERGLEPGFGFLFDPAFFDIGQKLIEYNSQATFGRAMLVGLLNTLLVSLLGIVLATIIGFLGNAGQSKYASSKAAMSGFSKSIALEVANRGISSNLKAHG